MRITVGHILILLMLGLFGVYMFNQAVNSDLVSQKSNGFLSDAMSWIGLFKTGKNSPVPVPTPVVETVAPISVVSSSTPAVVQEQKLEQKVAVVTPAVVPPPPAPKPHRRSKKSAMQQQGTGTALSLYRNPRKPRKTAAAKAVLAAESAKTGAKSLLGTYVMLELTSGKKIQGILEEKTATHYKLQLPGMGPFLYPVENVKSVQSAQ